MIKNYILIMFIMLLSACNSVGVKPTISKKTVDSPSPPVIEPIQPLASCEVLETTDDPESYEDLWQRVSSQMRFNIPDNHRIAVQKSWYVKHPEYLKRVTTRAQPYLYFIVTELEKRQLPLELALLPIVESAYDPFAYSHGRASGMWQFIPGTGKGYGLKQNWWFDGRRDIFLSTHAALDYLSYLNKRFRGDWLLALAAYNSGQGNVSRAIRHNRKKGKATDFWSLKLPKETKVYVPKLLALAEILSNQKTSLSKQDRQPHYLAQDEAKPVWAEIENQPFFTRIATDAQIDLTLAADLSEQSMQDFYKLNPAFNHWATPPKGPHYLLIPIEKADRFVDRLNTIPKNERISYQRYQIKQGDSLSSIAARFSTSINLLKSSNNMRSNQIRAGKSLLIPVPSKKRESYSKSSQQRLITKQNAKRSGHKKSIIVESGDSFWTLSRHYKVNLRSLAQWNNMAPNDTLKVGQKLVLWTKTPIKYASLRTTSLNQQKTRKIHYKVKNGDSFARIADKFNVSLTKIKTWNKLLSRKKYLQPGQSLTLFVDVTKQF